jgi:hypothetical protein
MKTCVVTLKADFGADFFHRLLKLLLARRSSMPPLIIISRQPLSAMDA